MVHMNGQGVIVTLPERGGYPKNVFFAVVSVSTPEDGIGKLVSVIAPDDEGQPLHWYADILIYDAGAEIYSVGI